MGKIKNIGIFLLSLFISVVAVYIYSPVIRTNAEGESGYTDVSIDIKPTIAIRSDLSELALESSVNNFVSGDVT